MKAISERQIKYLNILLSRHFGDNRKLYLKLFHEKESSKELNVIEASDIIEKFVDDNPKKDENVAIALNKIYKHQGQKSLL